MWGDWDAQISAGGYCLQTLDDSSQAVLGHCPSSCPFLRVRGLKWYRSILREWRRAKASDVRKIIASWDQQSENGAGLHSASFIVFLSSFLITYFETESHYVVQGDCKFIAILFPQPSKLLGTVRSHHIWFGFLHSLSFLNFMYVSVCLYITCIRCLHRPVEGNRSLETGVRHGWKLPCGCWVFNPGPLKTTQCS